MFPILYKRGSKGQILEWRISVWENPNDYIGKMLTVQYQGMTKNSIPRFPVGVRIREDV